MVDLGIGANERFWRVDVPFVSFSQIRFLEIGRNFRKQRFFETWAFPGCSFVTDGRIYVEIGANEKSWRVDVSFSRIWPKLGRMDTGVGANERSWRVDVPFDSFGLIRLPEVGRIWPKLSIKKRLFEK